jgi:hypothetical protein
LRQSLVRSFSARFVERRSWSAWRAARSIFPARLHHPRRAPARARVAEHRAVFRAMLEARETMSAEKDRTGG